MRFVDPSFHDGKVDNQRKSYGQSEIANILFFKALAGRLNSKGLKAYSLHPGVTLGTSLASPGLADEDLAALRAKDRKIGWDRTLDFKNLNECAATHLLVAFDPRLNIYNGVYLENGNLSDYLQPNATNAKDEERLWKLSENLSKRSLYIKIKSKVVKPSQDQGLLTGTNRQQRSCKPCTF